MAKRESEKLIERKLREGVKARGGECIKQDGTSADGLPDRALYMPGGLTVFVETKSTGDKPSPLQRYWHNKLKRLGYKVYVIDTTDKLEELWKNL